MTDKKIIFEQNTGEPFRIFNIEYKKAFKQNQEVIDAMVIATSLKDKVSSRYVNLKYVKNNKLIFFSNFNSRKGHEILNNPYVSCVIYWNKINIQIRIEGTAKPSEKIISDEHYYSREYSKNIAAVTSNQSLKIDSYESIVKIYEENLELYKDNNPKRPDNWGGISISPFYFEFWEGKDTRLNKRTSYELINENEWEKTFLQP